jgi:Fe-Mn family superoxide dismutase
MQRHEDGLNIAIDGLNELWGLTPKELLSVRGIPKIYREDICYYARACLCFEHYIKSFDFLRNEIALPKGMLACALKRDIGSYEEFCYRFMEAGKRFRYSGFLYLISQNGRLSLITERDYETPNGEVLLAFSLFENAYLERYGDRREPYLFECLKRANWERAEGLYEKA